MGITQGIGTRECISFRQRIFADLETLSVSLAEDYRRQTDQRSYRDANLRLLKFHQQLVIRDLNLAAPDSDLRAFADARALECQQARSERGPQKPALAVCLRVVARYRLEAPSPAKYSEAEQMERLVDARWWYRRIRRKAAQLLEQTSRDLGLVCKLRSIYASDRAHSDRIRIKLATRQFLETRMAVNEAGQGFSLAELADRSVSNPVIRRAELMVRFRGFEEVAELRGDIGLFVTLTTPSRMHASLATGVANPAYDGTSTLEAQQYLCRVWARVRAMLARCAIRTYGFRIAEPHHDGTPHWHFLLFADPRYHADIVGAFQRYGLESDPDEPGARRHRVKVEAIDTSRGSATGYVAKYVAKNVDGACIERDLYGTDAPTAAQRIEAWARLWGVRQFQQIGGPPVTVWRELRRLADADDPGLDRIRKAADASDWAAFVLLMGGIDIPRAAFSLAMVKLPSGDASESQSPAVVLLVKATGELVSTRQHRWEIQHSQDARAGPWPARALDLCQ